MTIFTSLWVVLAAVKSCAIGTAEVRGGALTLTFDDAEKAANVEAGMNVSVGVLVTPVLSVGTDEDGELLAVADVNLPYGSYEAKVG